MGKPKKNTNGAKKGPAADKKKSQPQPPFAISQQEYQDLVVQVKDLTLEEVQEEWILAARYGDLDVMHAVMQGCPMFASHRDTVIDGSCQDKDDVNDGNTALHMAAANGHVAVVQVLLDLLLDDKNKATAYTLKPNHSGNTPLHWAAANGHDTVVELLLQRVKDVDVLQKNSFGRSALTEGFTSQNTNVVKHLLEHDSAAEEKLLQGSTPVDVDDDDANLNDVQGEAKDENTAPSSDVDKNSNDGNNNTSKDGGLTKPQTDVGLLHDFDFRIGDETTDNNHPPTEGNLIIRELPIPISHDPFGDRPELDTTGYGIWAASLVMARWMAASSARFHGKRLLELGAGCGVPGLAAAYYSDAAQVYLTDLNPTTIDNLKYNIQLNQQHTCPSGTPWTERLNAGPINWEDSKTWPNEKIDFIIGSDLIYQSSIVPILKQVVLGLCQGEGTFLYVAPDIESDIGRDGLEEFIQSMKATDGIELVSDAKAPKEYHANPLSSQDDDLCFLHFHELSSASYRLYEFKISIS